MLFWPRKNQTINLLARHYNSPRDQFVKKEYMTTGWGRKTSGYRAIEQAEQLGTPFMLLEDGFLRSVGRGDEALSIVVDDLGIYYDAASPSRLEELIKTPLTPQQENRANALLKSWRECRVSKYNEAREYSGVLPEQYVLVIDQTYGDASLKYGLADASSFDQMLKAALIENPDKIIVVKVHPDIYTRKKKAHFDVETLRKMSRVHVIGENCHPVRLLEKADAVYTVTSQMGFEALIWGKKVRCFGMPFYAGWGLTWDELPAPPRRGKASLHQLIHAALVEYPRYVDPERNERCEVETVLSYVSHQRHMRQRVPETLYAIGFSRWKKSILKSFLKGADVRFVRRSSVIPRGSDVVFWGNVPPSKLPPNTRLIRIEDGFLRSVGLGADLVRPLSWVIDPVGLYYDASQPSKLETILQKTCFSREILQRAQALRKSIVHSGLSKYNLSGGGWERVKTDRQVILVPGQVESDSSIRFGTADIKTNMGLLKAVRKNRPEAYILYKPHPDVVAGLRHRGVEEENAQQWCDEIVNNTSTMDMLSQVDEVHTLTSLVGFEALLRQKSVTCYGRPFYAGWGLTHDIFPIPRRTRKLSLDELVVGTLILYPTYVSRYTRTYTTPERAIEELLQWRKEGASGMPVWRRVLRSILRIGKLVKKE